MNVAADGDVLDDFADIVAVFQNRVTILEIGKRDLVAERYVVRALTVIVSSDSIFQPVRSIPVFTSSTTTTPTVSVSL